MRRYFLFLVAGALAAILSFSGCHKDLSADDQPNNTIRIGVITSLTGANAAFGQAHKAGYTIALEQINAAGGIHGKKIDLDYYDDQSSGEKAIPGVSKLADQDHVPLILGAYSSESTRAIEPVVTQKQVPLIMPTATADNVMETGSPWVFRICAGSGAYADTILDFLKHNGDPKTLAIIYENTNFGQSNNKSMSAAAQKAGLKVVASEPYPTSSPDYKALLLRVKAKNPDVIYFASYLLDASSLMRQAQQVNLNPKYFTSAGAGFAAAEFPRPDKGAGKDAEYTFSASQWLPSAAWAGAKEFDQKYYQITGDHPAHHGMEAYVTLLAAAEALRNAQPTITPTALRDALRQLNLPETPFGPIKFDQRGQNAHPVLVTQIQGGQYKVVWPAEVATAKPILPTPAWNKR
jgi:branched-chain amino acid transport system substrate-binding protein